MKFTVLVNQALSWDQQKTLQKSQESYDNPYKAPFSGNYLSCKGFTHLKVDINKVDILLNAVCKCSIYFINFLKMIRWLDIYYGLLLGPVKSENVFLIIFDPEFQWM